MFLSIFSVNKHEAEYLVNALELSFPHAPMGIAHISSHPSMAIGEAEIEIRTKEPLTLAQRRFLVAHGFTISVKYRTDN